MNIHYKAVRLDRTSHYDKETKWRKGATVRVENPDPPERGACGRGIHSSASLLDAVGYQAGPSIYARVEPLDEIASDGTKTRSSAVRVVSWLTREETDEIAGFKLWEANHPVCPLRARRDFSLNVPALVDEWASVGDSVGDSVRDSVWASVGASVRDSVWASVGASVWDSVWASVRASVWASVWASVGDSVRDSVRAYTGGLFPNTKRWKYAEDLGPDPWRPLLTLWYGGYVPSFDGKMWRVHTGRGAKVVCEVET